MALLYPVAQVREWLQEEDAKLFAGVDSNFLTLVGDAELIRIWEEPVEDGQNDMIEFLDVYTSDINYPTAKNSVDDPLVENEEHSGTWRQAFVRPIKRGDRNFVVQGLRKGFLTTILFGVRPDFTTARLVEATGGPDHSARVSTSSLYIVVEWKNVDPFKVVEIVQEFEDTVGLTAHNPFTPTALYGDVPVPNGGETLEYLRVVSRMEDDGSATVTGFFQNSNTTTYTHSSEYELTGYSGWLTHSRADRVNHWGVPRSLAQAVMDAVKAEGVSVSSSYNREQGTVDIVVITESVNKIAYDIEKQTTTCLFTVYESLETGLNYAEATTTANSSPDPVAGAVYDRTFSINSQTGLYDVKIDTKLSHPTIAAIAWESGNSDVYFYDYKNLRNPTSDFPDLEESSTTTASISTNKDCTYDMTVRSKADESIAGGGGAFNNQRDQMRLHSSKAGDERQFYVSKIFTTSFADAADFAAGTDGGTHGGTPDHHVAVGGFDGHKTDWRPLANNKWTAVRVDLPSVWPLPT